MPLFSPGDRQFLERLSDLAYCNPFLPERMELEREILGESFDPSASVWSKLHELDSERRNVVRIGQRASELVEHIRGELATGKAATERELVLYEDLVLYWLYYRHRSQLDSELQDPKTEGARQLARNWRSFLADFRRTLAIPERTFPSRLDPAHLFACYFQIRRAFYYIYHFIVGGSLPAARLRAAIWQSIFTHDMRRYRRSLYQRMSDVATLICGPSGTGKELVARAIGLSRYVPFRPESESFACDFAGTFHPLNLSALAPTLIESGLFGHCRGSFTGAVGDRAGWLEICPELGTVFLDEIGELDPGLQVKLLRVLQTRTFQRLGEAVERPFRGKIIAATNRDLAAEMRGGAFRPDFYYRICSDLVSTPSLREQIADSPEELSRLIQFISQRIAGEEGASIAAEAEDWISRRLPRDYLWPGNFRELEQCVRNVMIRKEYHPPPAGDRIGEDLASLIENGALTADSLLRRYCTITYARLKSYEQTAQLLGLDRRTVKSKIDLDLLARLDQQGDGRQ